MIDPAAPQPLWRAVAWGWGWMALLALAAMNVGRMNALGLAAATLVLSLPPMLALWHAGAVRRLVALQQFEAGRWLHRWGSRRAIGMAAQALLAIVWTGALLLQSVFFGAVEWALVGLMPVLCALAMHGIAARSRRQFRRVVFARRWVAWAAQGVAVGVVVLAWIGLRLGLADAQPLPLAERVHALQSGWVQSPSGIVRWALDAGAWGQAGLESLGPWLEASPDAPGWRLALALVVAPLAVFAHLALSLTGLWLPAAERRRVLAERLSADEPPPPLGAARTAVASAIAVIGVLLLGSVVGAVDSRLKAAGSAFAVQPLPACERIDGQVYRVGTAARLDALMADLRAGLDAARGPACERLADIERHAARGVDAYLDWYFSLGAEWLRLAAMLGGDVDLLLQTRLTQMVLSGADLERLLAGVRADHAWRAAQLDSARGAALQLLERNRLVVDARQCQVVPAVDAQAWTLQIGDASSRLAASSGAGLAAGAFAATVGTKAMGKLGMKTAGKVLSKAAAKKGIGALGAAAAGAAVGTAVVPGAGTAVGAALGAGVGLAVGAGVDIALLAAEERLTREALRADLIAAVSESLAAHRAAFGCG